MNIVFISGHSCIRCQKMALPLVERGHKVHMIAKKIPSMSEYYDSFTVCAGTNHYLAAIDNFAKSADVFHVHNEPSWFVTAVKERSDVPVVLDVHDSFLGRMTAEEEQERRDNGEAVFRVFTEERNNFQLADGLVFPGKEFADTVCSEFRLEQPRLVLPSYLPRQYYQYIGKEWIGGLVYEGRVDLKADIAKNPNMSGFKYCDYEELAKELHFLGIDFHIYGPQTVYEKFIEVYDKIAYLHGGKEFRHLLPAIGRHDWGLIGNIFPTAEWDVAMPNKLFDYIAASVPPVVINAKASADFVLEHGIGIVVESLEEFRSRWSEHRECRKRLIKFRQKWIMEKHIHNLEGLYNVLC